MNNAVQHIHVKREDGSIVLFPVSKSVLSLRTPSTSSAENCQGEALTILAESSTPKKRSLFSWKRSALRGTVSLLLVAVTYGGSPLFLGSTLSFFRDDEVSRANLFAAASLAFDLNPGEVTLDIRAGESVFISPKFTPNDGTLPITYRITAEVVGEHAPLCSQLMASGTTSPIVYDGQLTALVTEPATEEGHASFEVGLLSTDGIAPDSQCTVDIVYRGWHSDSPENTGYTDEEADRFTFVYRAAEEEAPVEVIVEDVVVEETSAPEESNSEASDTPGDLPPSDPAPEPEPTPEPSLEPQPEPETQNFSPSGGGSSEPSETVEEPTPEDGAPPGGDASSDAELPEPPPETPSEAPETPPLETTPAPEPTPEPVPPQEPAPEVPIETPAPPIETPPAPSEA